MFAFTYFHCRHRGRDIRQPEGVDNPQAGQQSAEQLPGLGAGRQPRAGRPQPRQQPLELQVRLSQPLPRLPEEDRRQDSGQGGDPLRDGPLPRRGRHAAGQRHLRRPARKLR